SISRVSAAPPAGGAADTREIDTMAPALSLRALAAERIIGETSDLLSVEFLEIGVAAARAVGLITTRGTPNGTGFLVAPDVVLTNNHVLPDVRTARASALEMDFETNRHGPRKEVQSFELDPQGFFLTDVALDFTLVRVRPTSDGGQALSGYGFLPLIAAEGKIAVGEPLNIIQHPGGRVKQAALRNNRLLDLPPSNEADALNPDAVFHYETDTEKGSSGSPVFNDQWEVVALHHTGVPKTDASGAMIDADGRVVPDSQPGRIVWIGNEGIRISRLYQYIFTFTFADPAMASVRDALIALWTDAGRPGWARTTAEAGTIAHSPAALADPPSAAPAIGPPAIGPPAEERGAAVAPDPADPAHARRPGFRRDFLGLPTPLPRLIDDSRGPLATFGEGQTELRYHHYSVLMNARRRLAYVAAVNIDHRAPFDVQRGTDRWFFDPRLPKRLQAGGDYYAANPLDRGHLVRRDDAAWGYTQAEAQLANDDTFHWTNCSPQHEVFNQSAKASSKGLFLWGTLENAVAELAQATNGRLCVYNGPLFTEDDRPYRQDFFVPGTFWKLIALVDGQNRPRALAFRLSQAAQIADLPAEAFAPAELAAFTPAQIPVATLGALTGLDFGALAQWDPLAAGSDGVSKETLSPPRSIILTREADIVL
ncbi:DNA/RNA non-specific endonuclease, partial [Rhodospirillum rubrum]|uniref:DNA/RNA non-specific endonuclease n=1 Tax=Rhodospirillum rubrum TaxID=1085 RepID=UPI001905F429